MWEDILKRRSARETVEGLDDYDFNDVIGSELGYVMAGIKNKYYPHYTDERKERFDARVRKAGRYINQFEYIKALRIVRRIKEMVDQFNLPELDYLIEMLEIKGNERQTNS
tara:strand:- start:500 stop:832 length:333 start_codon:yes stop_codon:yes gene_type:complete